MRKSKLTITREVNKAFKLFKDDLKVWIIAHDDQECDRGFDYKEMQQKHIALKAANIARFYLWHNFNVSTSFLTLLGETLMLRGGTVERSKALIDIYKKNGG